MSSLTNPSGEAKAVFKGPDRAEKGSALSMIAAETRAVNDKTARLKALRLEREAQTDAAAAKVAAEAPAKKAPVRKRAKKADPA